MLCDFRSTIGMRWLCSPCECIQVHSRPSILNCHVLSEGITAMWQRLVVACYLYSLQVDPASTLPLRHSHIDCSLGHDLEAAARVTRQ